MHVVMNCVAGVRVCKDATRLTDS